MKKDKNTRIEEILASVDGIQKVNAPDFFYTRLKARMEKEATPAVSRPSILRPAFAFTALAAVLLLNAAVFFSQKKDSGETGISDAEILQSIAAEYNLNDNNTVLFDINQDK